MPALTSGGSSDAESATPESALAMPEPAPIATAMPEIAATSAETTTFATGGPRAAI